MTESLLPPARTRVGIPAPRPAYDDLIAPGLAGPPREAWPPPDAAAPEPYAHWWRRVVATLIDGLLAVPFCAVGFIGFVLLADNVTVLTDAANVPTGVDVRSARDAWISGGLAVGAWIGLLVFSFWNQVVRQGRHGASIGKACLYLMVVDERNGRPIGAFATFIRAIAHLLDGFVFYLGYLWPLVDARRQTFADKLMGTVVLHLPPLPRPEPAAYEAELPYGW